MSERDARFMLSALRLAQRGQPSPRPRVGAIVARGGEAISAGWNRSAVGPNASEQALVGAGGRTVGATLYLTYLGPEDLDVSGLAGDRGKKISARHSRHVRAALPMGATRADGAAQGAGARRSGIRSSSHAGRAAGAQIERWLAALAERGLSALVVGTLEPQLERAFAARGASGGVRCRFGVEGERCEGAIADYRKWRERGLPEVTLKAAITLDGRTAARNGESKWITGPRARAEAHRLRARADAVIVGVGTVLADDPELTVRAVRGRSPLRVVLDSELRTPPASKLVRTARATRTLVLHAPDASPARRRKLVAAGVELIEVRRARRSGLDPRAALRALAERGVVRALVEGGAQVHGALLDADLVDRAAVFIAPCLLGDARALPLALGQKPVVLASALRMREPQVTRLGPDLLVQGRLTRPGASSPG